MAHRVMKLHSEWVLAKMNMGSRGWFIGEFNPWVEKIPWRRERLPTPVFWPGEFHGLYSPWGHKESNRTEQILLSTMQSVLLDTCCVSGTVLGSRETMVSKTDEAALWKLL